MAEGTASPVHLPRRPIGQLGAAVLVWAALVSTAGAEETLPPVKPLFDSAVRDTCICLGPEGTYYLTGTTAANPAPARDKTGWWWVNEGIRLWKSRDLKQWQPLGLVWSLEKDATWAKQTKGGKRAVWAPEVHYINGTFWLPYSMNYRGCGLLKSTTGRAEGPYVDVKKDGPLTGRIDASLFQDDDGTVYWVYQDGRIARMNDDMTGLAEKPHLLKPANAKHVGFEGAFLSKYQNKYILMCADFNRSERGRTYDCMAAVADRVDGPYGDRYLAIRHAGHNMLFRTRDGLWMSTFFGTPHDSTAIFTERPAILPIAFDADGRFRPLRRTSAPPEAVAPSLDSPFHRGRGESQRWRSLLYCTAPFGRGNNSRARSSRFRTKGSSDGE